MSDILREIDEDLQREHMAALWRKYRFLVLGLIATIIFATASYSAWQQHRDKSEISRSVALGSVATKPDMPDAEKIEAFLGYAKTNSQSGQALLAQMAAIGTMLKNGKKPEALVQLDAIANAPKAPEILRSYARLIRIELQLDEGDPVQLRQMLEPLAADGQPWRFTARMLQGVLYGKHGDNAKAKDIFSKLSQEREAPTTLRDEARLLARYYATQG